MPSNLTRITIRLGEELNTKIRFIAEHNHRKINDEFKLIVEEYVNKFEETYGEIKLPERE